MSFSNLFKLLWRRTTNNRLKLEKFCFTSFLQTCHLLHDKLYHMETMDGHGSRGGGTNAIAMRDDSMLEEAWLNNEQG